MDQIRNRKPFASVRNIMSEALSSSESTDKSNNCEVALVTPVIVKKEFFAYHATSNKFESFNKNKGKCNGVSESIWKRRGAKPIQPLQFDPLIRYDGLMENLLAMESLLEIVDDNEWVLRNGHFEAHALEDVEDGIVINPPVFPAWYTVPTTGKVVPAQVPQCIDMLLEKAVKCGFSRSILSTVMGDVVTEYSKAMIHSRKRDLHEILILATPEIWQGVAAICAASKLHKLKMKVSVYIHEGNPKAPCTEELDFVAAGGKVYRDLNEIKDRKFRVVIVALENQRSRAGKEDRTTILPKFGEWIRYSVAILIDPPVLKCSYSAALQVACGGTYNISQKTVIFIPSLPKTMPVDNFIDMYVVDTAILTSIYEDCGIEPFNFRQKYGHNVVQQIVPQKFEDKGSKLYFYRNGKQILP